MFSQIPTLLLIKYVFKYTSTSTSSSVLLYISIYINPNVANLVKPT